MTTKKREVPQELLTQRLGHDRHASASNAAGNTRNGKSKKTLEGDFGELPVKVPLLLPHLCIAQV